MLADSRTFSDACVQRLPILNQLWVNAEPKPINFRQSLPSIDLVLHVSVVFVSVQYLYHWSFCCITVCNTQMNTCIATLHMFSTHMYDNRWIFMLCRVVTISKTASQSYVSCVYTYVCYMTPSQWCVSGLFFSLLSSAISQAETSQYTKTYTTLPPSDELSHSAASQSGIDELGHSTASQSGIDHLGHSTASRSGIDELGHSTASQSGIDDVQKCEVDVQPSPHVSDNQSSSGECCTLSIIPLSL